jgi:hypothetical protein
MSSPTFSILWGSQKAIYDGNVGFCGGVLFESVQYIDRWRKADQVQV